MPSNAFVDNRTNISAFITRFYSTCLDRGPDPTGFSGWLSLLKNGSSRELVFSGFINSQEFANLCSTYGIRSGASNSGLSTPANTDLNMQSCGLTESEILAIVNSHRSSNGLLL